MEGLGDLGRYPDTYKPEIVRDPNLLAEDMMNLLEAREFVRTAVNKWIDEQCGSSFPTDRVDGGPLRFGLDDEDD